MGERIGEEIQSEDLAMVAGVVCESIEELEEAKNADQCCQDSPGHHAGTTYAVTTRRDNGQPDLLDRQHIVEIHSVDRCNMDGTPEALAGHRSDEKAQMDARGFFVREHPAAATSWSVEETNNVVQIDRGCTVGGGEGDCAGEEAHQGHVETQWLVARCKLYVASGKS